MASPSDDDAAPPPRTLHPRPRDQRPHLPPHAPDPPEVSGASRRLRALAALSGSLTDALHPAEAADLVEQKALSALDVTSAVVVTLGAFPPAPAPTDGASIPPVADTLTLVHAIGLPAEVKAALQRLPLDAPVPLAEVARIGAPLFLPSEHEMRRYPDWGATMIGAGARAAAIVPVWANGELRGVLGLTWALPRDFDEDERAFVLTLGVMCAQAIMRAHLREAERVARESAERANRSKAHFVATISHELRTPMNAVMGYAQMLTDELDGPTSARQRDHLRRVRASGMHLLALVDDLLGYARVEAGVETVRVEPALLADVVEQTLSLLGPVAERKGVRIRVEAPTEAVALHTDLRKLRQILLNLLANAVKFTDSGDVVLALRVQGTAADVRVGFEITDNGRGMSVIEQSHAFDPFWQAESSVKVSGGSSGLGLSVARQFARLLGGDVWIGASAPGAGSTLVALLPARYTFTSGAGS